MVGEESAGVKLGRGGDRAGRGFIQTTHPSIELGCHLNTDIDGCEASFAVLAPIALLYC